MITPAEDGYATIPVDGEYIRTQQPKVGGYYVSYENGHKSWLPADAFGDPAAA